MICHDSSQRVSNRSNLSNLRLAPGMLGRPGRPPGRKPAASSGFSMGGLIPANKAAAGFMAAPGNTKRTLRPRGPWSLFQLREV